ncbi:AraC family transcriptional regulator [Paenibacillus piri]|uniref:AraC family transcriptional regulator n=1 Tax=Paenibacillus piri TaxID=2547395 RepID=A0A4R5KS64_9BACL|nr:AraC family transcriptional regulator [Paenibacillus piri]TDF98679.1 AraC family transcriptional regulator [Paenibacillus piri]
MYWNQPNTILKYDQLTVKHIRKDHFSMDDHFHSRYEITYLIDGERHFFIKDTTYTLQKGDLVFIAPADIHRSFDANPSGYEKIELYFDPKWIHKTGVIASDFDVVYPFDQENRMLRLASREQEYVESLLFKMMYEMKQQPAGYNHEITMLLTQLLMFSTRQCHLLTHQQPRTLPVSDNITRMIRYINENYTEKLCLEHLAAMFHFNPSYLSYRFKEVTGISFIEYVNSVRVKEAQKLLTKSSSPVTDIALQCGFTNLTHFGRVFKYITGITPSAYRRKHSIDSPRL